MWLFGALLTVLYWPAIYGPATSPRLAFLAVSLPILLFLTYRKVSFTWVHIVGVLFIFWAIVSLDWTSNWYDGVHELIKLVIIAEAFVLGTYLYSLRDLFIGLGIGLLFSLPMMFQGGLFVNINVLAETTLIVCVGLVVYRVWWLIPVLLPLIVVNGSRAAILTGIGLIAYTQSKRLCLVSVIAGLIILSQYRTDTIDLRIVLWEDTLSGLTMVGHGLGSFFTDYPFLTNSIDTVLSRPRYAHNDLMQISFELGLIGGILALVFCWLILQSDKQERYVFLAFLGVSCFSYPLHLPVSSFVMALVCGYVASSRVDVWLPINECRMALCTWGIRKVRSILSV